jgi:predicted transcriptional regulator
MIAYRKKGLTLQEIATLTGCTKQTVHYHMEQADLDGLESYAQHKADLIEIKQRELSKSLTSDDHKKMSGLQKIIGLKVQEETIRLMRGQATEIHDHNVLVCNVNKAIEQLRQEQGSIIDIPVDNPTYQPVCPSSDVP